MMMTILPTNGGPYSLAGVGGTWMILGLRSSTRIASSSSKTVTILDRSFFVAFDRSTTFAALADPCPI